MTNLFFVDGDLAQLESVTNFELDKISNWFRINYHLILKN